MRRTLHLLITLAFCPLLLYACKGKNTNEAQEQSTLLNIPFTIEAEDIVSNSGEINLSTIVKEIKYIPLETTDEAIVGNFHMAIQLNNKNWLVSDRNNIFMFDENGKYIRKVGNKGQGPEEYLRLSGIEANKETGGFYIIDNRKAICYDEQCRVTKVYETVLPTMMGLIAENGDLVTYKMDFLKEPNDSTKSVSLYRYNKEGELIKEYENRSPRIRKEGTIPLVSPLRPFYYYKSQIHFNEIGNDTIFIVTKDSLAPYAILNLGKLKMNVTPINQSGSEGEISSILEGLKETLYFIGAQEDDRYLYLSFLWGFSEDNLKAVYNKKEKKLTCLTSDALINDIDGGPDFFPTQNNYRNQYIAGISAEDFRKAVFSNSLDEGMKKYGKNFEELYQLASSLEEDDNPILMIVK